MVAPNGGDRTFGGKGGPEGKLRGRPPPPVEPRSGPWRRTGSESGAGRARTRHGLSIGARGTVQRRIPEKVRGPRFAGAFAAAGTLPLSLSAAHSARRARAAGASDVDAGGRRPHASRRAASATRRCAPGARL